jgi:hypothetical protein
MIDDVELAELRGEAEEWMGDECRITRPSATRTIDAETLVETPAAGTVIYEGRCAVTVSRGAQPAAPGEEPVMILSTRALLPVAAVGIRPGDQLELTSSQDPDMADRVFRVSEIDRRSRSVHRVLQIEETQR